MTTFNNDSLKKELASEFITRNDLVNRWGNVISSYLLLPGLVGFWPMSTVARSTASAIDLSGQGWTLTRNGNVQFNLHNSIVPYAEFDGSGDSLSTANANDLDISGTETFYDNKGLTMGGWFWNDGAGATGGLMGKWTESGNQRSYLLLTLSDTFRFAISGNGTANTQFSHSSTFSTGTWYFVVGKFEPSVMMSVFMNGEKASTTTSIPSSIFNGTSDFEIGSYNALTQDLDGRATLCFLCAYALPDNLIFNLFEQSRLLFGTT